LGFAFAAELARGWGNGIEWKTLEAGLQEAKESNKPAMVIIHKTWCGACKNLKPKIANSKEVEKASKDFVMINVQDDEEPSDSAYSPDGGYIPRIIFVEPNGKVRPDIYNFGRDKYKYFYSTDSEVLKGMSDALKALSPAHKEL